MKPSDTISLLLCVHSRDKLHDVLLENALGSVIRQSRRPDEVVVVMDECWEKTRGVIDSFESMAISVFERPKKQGLAYAKNFGIAKCSCDWITYLDADDQLMDCKLEVQSQYLITHPDIDFCGTESWDLDHGILRPNCFQVGQYQTHEEIVERLPYENIMCHGSMMMRASALALLDSGLYRDVRGAEDWDLWKRAANAGCIFGKVPERLYIWSAGTSVAR